MIIGKQDEENLMKLLNMWHKEKKTEDGEQKYKNYGESPEEI